MEVKMASKDLPAKVECFRKKSVQCKRFAGYLLLGVLMVSYPVAVNSQTTIEFSLDEELAVNSTVGNIINQAKLHNKYDLNVLSVLQFQILTTTAIVRNNFKVYSDSPDIVTTSVIDRDQICPFQDICDVHLDIGVQPKEYFEIIKCVIHIVDINDHSPVFPDGIVSLYISESASAGASFGIPAAEDLDSTANGIHTFQLLNFQSQFELRVSESGDGTKDLSLVLKSGLDREENEMYTLNIVAVDGGTPPKSGSVTVEVSVLDSNDNSPQFENAVYEVYLNENEPIGTSVIQVRAVDKDAGQHGEIQYQFSRQSQALFGDTFQINPVNGQIITKNYIDYEERQNYTLRIVARDSGPSSMSGSAQLIIRVRDINDNSPVITVNALSVSGDAEVAENKAVDEFVAHISVSDPDGGVSGQVRCSIDNSLFKLTQLYAKEFKIVTNTIFDREVRANYNVVVTCLDKGVNPRTASRRINITIVDENDHFPVFEQKVYSTQMRENSGTGIQLLKVNASDLDSDLNGQVKYTLQPVGLYGEGVLRIEPSSGNVFIMKSLNYEVQTQYTYQVVASDRGNPPKSSTASLVLSVEDVNDEVPTFSQPKFVFTVNESISVGTKVGTILAYDLDSPPFNSISYSLIAIGKDSKFRIDSVSGEVFSTDRLDKEMMGTQQSYELMVTASNTGYGLQNSVAVSIYVDDVNDNSPVVLFPSVENNFIQVKSNAEKDDLVTQIRATDRDMGKNSALKYAIIPHGNDLFHINQETGKVFVSKSLTDYGGNEVKLLVEVSDRGNPPLSVKTQLNIVINATAFGSEELTTDLSYVVAIAVSSVILVVLAVFIFVVFLIRRRRRDAVKQKAMYSLTLEKSVVSVCNDTGAEVPTISGTCPATSNQYSWPDVIDVKQILGGKQNGKKKKGSSGVEKESGLEVAHLSKRVTFKESLESLCDDNKPSKTSPVFREESRHKLLYGHHPPLKQPAVLTAHSLQGVYNGHPQRDDDLSSDQGSSTDSGRGLSEEDQDHNRSQQSTSSDRPSNDSSEYICMSQAQRIRNQPTLPPKKPQTSLLYPPSYHSRNHTSRLVSASSPEITLDKHKQYSGGFSGPYRGSEALVPSHLAPSASFNDINGKNIGKYSCRQPGGVVDRPVSSGSTVQYQQPYVKPSRMGPELRNHGDTGRLQYGNRWSGLDYPSMSGPETGSEAGSSTSGSYIVDHVDLDTAEMSNDVFV